jgi:hypothetical protein
MKEEKKMIVAPRLLPPCPMALSVVAALFEVSFPTLTRYRNPFLSHNFLLSPIAEPQVDSDGVKRRKKRNRWGDQQENKAAGLMGLPTMIMANFTSEQLEAYTLHLRIEEISQKLRINDVVPADGDRYVPI